ncbi:MAG: ATP-binding protein [Lentisphaeria bacterium]
MNESPANTTVRLSTAHMFEQLLDWFPDIIQSVDAAGNLVYANRKASELLGYSRDELLGKNVMEIYAPEVLDKVRRGFAALRDRGNLSVNESLLLSKTGECIPVEIRSFAVYDAAGQFLRTFSILRDIREVKELQNNLIHAGRLAAIGELAACVAHDINNPLSVIKLYLNLLESEAKAIPNLPPDAAQLITDAVTSVGKAADRIERLSNHLREFSRSRESRAELVNLNEVVTDALFMVTGKINDSSVTVIREAPQTTPYVLGSPGEIEQVLMNLFANACDVTRGRADAELAIRISEVTRGARRQHWAIEVRDNGTGIPPEVRDQIFTPFFTTKPKGQGTGLGLSISRHIIRKHRGEIQVESEPGGGAIFTVFLPVADPAVFAKPPAPEADADAGATV